MATPPPTGKQKKVKYKEMFYLTENLHFSIARKRAVSATKGNKTTLKVKNKSKQQK